MTTRKLPEIESWVLEDVEVGERVQGQFPPLDIKQDFQASYAESFALNRQSAIMQFLHGNSEMVSFDGRLFAEYITDSIKEPLKILRGWTKRDPAYARPRTLLFWVGDATISMRCVLESLSPVITHSFRKDGSQRDVSFTVNLRQYVPYELEVEAADTRYHLARLHDYYEWLAQREYGDPMLGVVLRNSHPTKTNLEVGDVVKLPSRENIRKETAKTESIALKTAYGRKETPQRNLRIEVFERLNRKVTSHVVLS